MFLLRLYSVTKCITYIVLKCAAIMSLNAKMKDYLLEVSQILSRYY